MLLTTKRWDTSHTASTRLRSVPFGVGIIRQYYIAFITCLSSRFMSMMAAFLDPVPLRTSETLRGRLIVASVTHNHYIDSLKPGPVIDFSTSEGQYSNHRTLSLDPSDAAAIPETVNK
jgi:hypothetical protein